MASKTVRVYLGTRKGGYVAESDAKRRKWSVRGPFQPGKDVFHVYPDPRHPGTVYSAANSGFVGPMFYRSTDHGRKWTELAPPMMTLSKARPSPFGADGPPHYPIVNLWHIEAGPVSEPSTVFLGVDPASLYRSDDSGASWAPVPGLNDHATRPKWNPGAGGMCLHTILIDPTRPSRMYVGISAAGMFRSDDSGEHWRPANRGVAVSFMPEKHPEVGQCVHKVALDPAHPETSYRQDHDGIFVSHDGMENWKRVGRPLESDFGFVVGVAQTRPGQAYFVPLEEKTRTGFTKGPEVFRWAERSRSWAPTIRNRLTPGDVGTHREALALDRLDPPGIYLGTTTGQLLVSPDGDRNWLQVPYLFPSIHSVAVASPENSGS
ncbi:MAG: hypothetical protein L3J99_06355 [Thermoplasmata archaeon]|nr:hypothetical protein [Thermoplasmata archaeon]